MLIVAPYGLGLRDLILNDELGAYLTSRFDVDIVSPFKFDDPSDWGLSRVFPQRQSGVLNHLLYLLNHRATSVRRHLARRNFYLGTGWPNIYKMQKLTDSLLPVTYVDYDRWARFSRGPWGAVIKSIVNRFPIKYPNSNLIDSTDYRSVIVVHPGDAECVIMARAAHKRGIPVIALSMGMDNLMSHGPTLMVPDLFLLWGEEQLDSFEHHHRKFYSALDATRPVAIGGLAHDRFIGGEGTEAFEIAYPDIAPTTRVITYATYGEFEYPRQTETCQTILDVLESQGVDAHLIVRRRPIGTDNDMWDDFASAQPDKITIQTPVGVSFTKSGSRRAGTRSSEIEEMELYAATLRRSSLVATGGFSTVYLDAHAVGTPSIAVALPQMGETGPSITMINCNAYGEDIPSMGMVEYVGTHERLSEIVTEVVVREDIAGRFEENAAVYAIQAGKRDGKAGERAVAAIRQLLG